MPCPFEVEIPRVFAIYNEAAIYNAWGGGAWNYNHMEEKKKATSCVECGQCEAACPQQLSIRELLKEAHKALTEV